MRKEWVYFILFVGLLSTIPDSSAGTVVFIYSTDSASANDFKSLLDTAGYSTDLISSDNIAATDFSKYDLIIIGNDIPNSGFNSALPGSDITKISNSAKPIIGIGHGGAYLFGSLNLVTSYGNSWDWTTPHNIIVMDKTQIVFNKPKSIVIPTNNIIQLYSAGYESAVYLPSIPTNVTVLGMEDGTDGKHYTLTLENSKYVKWGFFKSPTSMTQTGKDLFINIVNFFVPIYPPNTPSQPAGQSSGSSGTSYTYSTSSTDPNNDQIKYTFDWGDQTQSSTNFVNSGSSASASHSWTNPGTYNVKAMATDIGGLPSGWSTSLTVTIESTPRLSMSPDPLSFNLGTMNAGESSSQIFSISNTGGGILTWSVSDNQPWITMNPTSGTNSGTVTLNINTDGLDPDTYIGIITVTSNGGTKAGKVFFNIPASAVTTTPPAVITPTPVETTPSPITPPPTVTNGGNGGGGKDVRWVEILIILLAIAILIAFFLLRRKTGKPEKKQQQVKQKLEKCPKCGAKVLEGASFCDECGEPL